MQLLLMIFFLKLKEKIPLIACFVKKLSETIIHFFCESEVVKPIWNDLDKIVRNKHDINFASSPFEKMFGIQGAKFITYLFLCVKYFLYVCKFQNKIPDFTNFVNFLKNNRETEYNIAKRNDKLSIHFKKWRFDL